MDWKKEIKETLRMFREGLIDKSLASALWEYETHEERKERRA